MKKTLMVILLVISMTLSACSSKDDQDMDSVEGEQETITIENEDQEDEDLDEEDIDLEEAEDENIAEGEEAEEQATEDKEKDQLEENSKEPAEKAPAKSEPVEKEPEKKEVEAPKEEKANALHIEGKVSNPISLDLNDLKGMNDIIFKGDFYSLNNFGTTAHTEFKGVNLWSLLNSKAGILDDASKVRIIASDGYEMEYTIGQVKRQDYIDETDPAAKFPMIIAWEENGVEYDLSDGLPFKLVVGQKEAGDTNKPQWVSNIEKILVE